MTDNDLLQGVFNITPTPFNPNGSLDEESLVRLTEVVIRSGVNGMTILGVLGEAGKVTERERERIIAVVMEATAGRIPVCVGASHTGTDCAARYCRQAEAMGAQAVMVSPPKLSRSSNEALRRHYLTVAEAVNLPIVVQDHPASTGVRMDAEFIADLAKEAPSLGFLKLEDPPTPYKVSRVLEANPRIRIFGGLGGMMFLEELMHGAVGTMTGFAFPRILVKVFQRFQEDDLDGAADLFFRYTPIIRFENQPLINLALRKRIYRLQGAISCDRVRQPHTPLDEDTKKDLDFLLERLRLLPES